LGAPEHRGRARLTAKRTAALQRGIRTLLRLLDDTAYSRADAPGTKYVP
jgi:hypothetical protein